MAATYEPLLLAARAKKPRQAGQTLAKLHILVECCEHCLVPKEIIKSFLSDNNMKRRNEDLAEDTLTQLLGK
jgi:hypothetical protein